MGAASARVAAAHRRRRWRRRLQQPRRLQPHRPQTARATSRSASGASPNWRTPSSIDEAHHFRNPGRQRRRGRGEPIPLLQALRPARQRCAAEDALHADRHADQQPAQRLSPHGRTVHAAGRGVLRPHPRREQPARALQQHGEGAAQHGRRTRSRTYRGTWPRRRRSWQRTTSSDSSSCSAAGPTRGRARSARPARPPPSRSARPRRSPSTRSARPTAGCSTCSRRPFPQEPALHPADVLPVGLVQGAGQEHRSLRAEPAEAGRRPDPHQLPEALREFGRRVRAFLRPAAARSCSPSWRFTARPMPRRSGWSAGRLRTPRSSAMRANASSTSGAKTRTTTTRTSCLRRCSMLSSASTARSTTSRR